MAGRSLSFLTSAIHKCFGSLHSSPRAFGLPTSRRTMPMNSSSLRVCPIWTSLFVGEIMVILRTCRSTMSLGTRFGHRPPKPNQKYLPSRMTFQTSSPPERCCDKKTCNVCNLMFNNFLGGNFRPLKPTDILLVPMPHPPHPRIPPTPFLFQIKKRTPLLALDSSLSVSLHRRIFS